MCFGRVEVLQYSEVLLISPWWGQTKCGFNSETKIPIGISCLGHRNRWSKYQIGHIIKWTYLELETISLKDVFFSPLTKWLWSMLAILSSTIEQQTTHKPNLLQFLHWMVITSCCFNLCYTQFVFEWMLTSLSTQRALEGSVKPLSSVCEELQWIYWFCKLINLLSLI